MNRKRLQKVLVMRKNIKFTLIWITFVIGSFFHDYLPLPSSYFSNPKNFFNQFFVKKGWGWTFFLLSGYISSLLVKQKAYNLLTLYKHLSRLFVTTFFWFAFTTAFEMINTKTGMCLGGKEIGSKYLCVSNGLLWNGYDISGHAFLLTFCILIINEELNCSNNILTLTHNGVTRSTEIQNGKGVRNVFGFVVNEEVFEHFIEWLGLLLVLLMLLWEIMLFFTCLYFHTLSEKLIGVACGGMAFYSCYMILFKIDHRFAPCTPSMIAKLNHDL